MRRDRDKREKKLRKQLERQAKRLQQSRAKPGVNTATLVEAIQNTLADLRAMNRSKAPADLVGHETYALLTHELGVDVNDILANVPYSHIVKSSSGNTNAGSDDDLCRLSPSSYSSPSSICSSARQGGQGHGHPLSMTPSMGGMPGMPGIMGGPAGMGLMANELLLLASQSRALQQQQHALASPIYRGEILEDPRTPKTLTKSKSSAFSIDHLLETRNERTREPSMTS